ncbi:unnamed protein product [Victoria cruziana]
MNHLPVEATEDTFSFSLEYPANNDIDAFKCIVENDPSKIDDVGLWYGRLKGTARTRVPPCTVLPPVALPTPWKLSISL